MYTTRNAAIPYHYGRKHHKDIVAEETPRRYTPREQHPHYGKNNFSIRTVKIRNSLPETIVFAPSINAFKNAIDNHGKIKNYISISE